MLDPCSHICNILYQSFRIFNLIELILCQLVLEFFRYTLLIRLIFRYILVDFDQRASDDIFILIQLLFTDLVITENFLDSLALFFFRLYLFLNFLSALALQLFLDTFYLLTRSRNILIDSCQIFILYINVLIKFMQLLFKSLLVLFLFFLLFYIFFGLFSLSNRLLLLPFLRFSLVLQISVSQCLIRYGISQKLLQILYKLRPLFL